MHYHLKFGEGVDSMRKESVPKIGKFTEAVVRRCSVKKVFLKVSQNSQENSCARVSFLIKFQKKRLWHRYFPVNFVKLLRTPISIEYL